MQLKSLRDFADEKKVSMRSLQKHIKNHESDLEGHIVRYGPPRGTFIDEYAQEYISSHLVGYSVEVVDTALQEEAERLRAELEAANKRIISLLDERIALTERALQAENTRELAEATRQAQDERIQELEGKLSEATERALQAEETAQKLKGRTLWQRIRRWGED